MFTKSLISAAILLSLSAASSASESKLHRLAKVAKPTEHHVKLNLDPSKERFDGQSIIHLEVLKPTKTIEINGLDYAIEFAKLVGEQSCDLANEMLKTGKVILSCEQTLAPGKYKLTVDFNAPYNRQSVGLYKTVDRGTPYLFTQFQMSDARRAFPVFDEPEYKIPFQLTITAPDSQKVFANTQVIKTEKSNGNTTHYFEKTLPLPSYLIAMSVGPFEVSPVSGMSVPGNVITPEGKSSVSASSIKETPKILKALEDYFDLPYVYSKLDQVAVPEFPFGAMENAGLVTYREDILLIDPEASSRNKKVYHVNVIAHELAHQWYGNLVTMKWWNDLWLNEAFATWMAAKITKQLYPELETHLDLPQNKAMYTDAKVSTLPVRRTINTEADIMNGLRLAYDKGSAVLNMVENWLGEDVFRQGMRNYIRKYSYKNAEAADLWRELGAVSGKDVESVLSSFMSQSSFPLLTVNSQGKNLTISQQRFIIEGQTAPEQSWHVPMTIKYGRGDKVVTKSILLSNKSKSIKLDFEPEWIYPDADTLGYYRWKLDSQSLAALLDNAPKVLNVRERLNLLAGTTELMDAGKINAKEMMTIMARFVDDANPVVAKKALATLVAQKKSFEDDSNKALWKKLFTTYVEPAYKQYGLTAKAGEPAAISELRTTLLWVLAIETDNAEIIKHASEQAKIYLKEPSKVDPFLASMFVSIAAYYGDADLLAKYQSTFEATKNPAQRTALLSAMGLFGGDLQKQVADYLLSDKITASDTRYIVGGFGQDEERRALFRKWLLENMDAVLTKLPPFLQPMLPGLYFTQCEKAELNTMKSIFAEKAKEVDGMSVTIDKVEESVTTCLNLKNRELASVNEFLKQL
ncbi:M1 family metallopeptidase (plasmid) [Pseudoalteromonas sp. T1lg65]|uniref:M1 family metallopeptidase n=1 Tax=Pseudoalteromonas sp. T1lg65 TaxID=2077101 RepID=UPI003F7B0F2A